MQKCSWQHNARLILNYTGGNSTKAKLVKHEVHPSQLSIILTIERPTVEKPTLHATNALHIQWYSKVREPL